MVLQWGLEPKEGTDMQLPTVFRSSSNPLPPMYAWPRKVKRTLLALSVAVVVAAYLLLAGGVIAALAVLAERVSN
jgi:hypothetical protein